MKPTSLETSSAPLLSRCISMPVDISGLGHQVELGEAIKYHLFTYFCLQWVFVAVQGGSSSLWCTGFSCSGISYCKAWALECALSRCGARAYLLGGMWDLPGGIVQVSPALAGGFLTTGSPGKSTCLPVLIFLIHEVGILRAFLMSFFFLWVLVEMVLSHCTEKGCKG